MTRFETWSLVLQFCIFVAGTATVVIYFFQLRTMNKQLEALTTSLAQSRDQAEASANAAALSLSRDFLSVEFHNAVRRPAWHALRKARKDDSYRSELVARIGHSSADQNDEDHWRHEARRLGRDLRGDREYWAFHDERHRVADILGFFVSLSQLPADQTVVRACGYFYDSWRLPLWRLIMDVEVYLDSAQNSASARAAPRLLQYRLALVKLDQLFGFPEVDPAKDPYFDTFTADGKVPL
jgi:hypothetical protein